MGSPGADVLIIVDWARLVGGWSAADGAVFFF